MRRIGFVVNPIAGLGGSVGLKGTDCKIREALQKGAVPRAGTRAAETLQQVLAGDIEFLTCAGPMGEDSLKAAGKTNYSVLSHPPRSTRPEDTKEACTRFIEGGADLIVFCGGDGTARDVFDAVGSRIPILGIPAGVKMYSAVFALNPAAAGEIMEGAGSLPFRDSEILDVDEEAYRKGELLTRLYGIARVPVLAGRIQAAKHVIEEQDEERAKKEIARFITEVMLPDTYYILGAGTTAGAISHHLGIPKTLLGVDVIKDGKLIAQDADENTLLALLKKGQPVSVIVSPIGAQGFIFGRGTQQISTEVIRGVGVKNVIIVATPGKCADTPLMHVDTGDEVLDAEFGESVRVITGYRIAQRKKIGR